MEDLFMFMTSIVGIIGTLVFIFAIAFCFKNFLMDYLESNSFIKNLLFKAFSLGLLLSSAFFIAASIDLKGVLMRLATEINQMSIQEIAMLNYHKQFFQNEIVILSILQIISLAMLFILFRNIKNEIKMNSKARERWDWEKLK